MNLFHTMNNAQLRDYLWSMCLENVRFPLQELLLEEIVIPNEKLIILIIVVFELTVGVLILNKKILIKIGLSLTILWVLFVSLFLSFIDILGHIILGIFQGLLLMGNYDKTILDILRERIPPKESVSS